MLKILLSYVPLRDCLTKTTKQNRLPAAKKASLAAYIHYAQSLNRNINGTCTLLKILDNYFWSVNLALFGKKKQTGNPKKLSSFMSVHSRDTRDKHRYKIFNTFADAT